MILGLLKKVFKFPVSSLQNFRNDERIKILADR